MILEQILEYLDEEIERHKDQENRETGHWGRGFENGALTEAILLRIKIRALLQKDKREDTRKCIILIL